MTATALAIAPPPEAMDRVAEIVASASIPPDPTASAITRHLPALSGKGLRPRLTLLAAAAAAPAAAAPFDAAAGIELMHLGSLHHDDVVDGARERRGRPTVAALWGNRAATFAGTFLLARGAELIARAGDEAAAAAAACTHEMWQGQTRELVSRFRVERTEDEYLAIAVSKTGSLFGLAAEVGALAAGGRTPVTAACREFGRLLGTAFQLADDIADLTGDPAALGKPVLADVRAGIYTLPVILALASGGAEAKSLRELLGAPGLGDREAAEVRRQVAACGAVEASLQAFRGLVDRAHSALHPLPQGFAAERLHQFAEELASAA